jgi:hypothetical protein
MDKHTITVEKYGCRMEVDVECFNRDVARGIVTKAPAESGMKGHRIEVDLEEVIEVFDKWEKPN